MRPGSQLAVAVSSNDCPLDKKHKLNPLCIAARLTAEHQESSCMEILICILAWDPLFFALSLLFFRFSSARARGVNIYSHLHPLCPRLPFWWLIFNARFSSDEGLSDSVTAPTARGKSSLCERDRGRCRVIFARVRACVSPYISFVMYIRSSFTLLHIFAINVAKGVLKCEGLYIYRRYVHLHMYTGRELSGKRWTIHGVGKLDK